MALIELPAIAARLERPMPEPELLPLTERLEHAFAARVADQSEATRLLLLVAALNDSDNVDEVLRAGSIIAGETLDFDLLEPAASATIIDLDLQTIRFRHPLIRSAVNQSASVSQRLAAHEALASILEDQPDRRIWHRAALMSGEHEDIASELEEAAGRARQRGAIGVAVTALRRAGELSGPGERWPPVARRGRAGLRPRPAGGLSTRSCAMSSASIWGRSSGRESRGSRRWPPRGRWAMPPDSRT